MADVGVLNLQIHADASQAKTSLEGLEKALGAVKKAVSALKLNTAAAAFDKINQNVTAETVSNLNGVATALERIKAACDFTIPDLKGLNKVAKAMNAVAGVSSAYRASTAGTSRTVQEVRELNTELERTLDLVQNKGWNANSEYSQFLNMFDRFSSNRMARALGAGSVTPDKMLSTWVDRGAQWQPDWSYGYGGEAIPVHGTVSDYTEVAEAVEEIADGFGEVESVIGEVTVEVEQLNEELEEFTELGHTAFTAWKYGFRGMEDGLETLRKVMTAWMDMKSRMALGSGQGPLLLGSGGVAPENMLSTWVDTSPQWRPDWVENGQAWQPDFTFGGTGGWNAEKIEQALAEIQRMKSQLMYDIQTGAVSQEQAEEIASGIDELEKRIPIIDETWKRTMRNVVQDTKGAMEQVKSSVEGVTRPQSASAAEVMAERIAWMRESLRDSTDAVKNYVASLFGLNPAEVWGNTAANIQTATQATQQMTQATREMADESLRVTYGREMVDNLVNNYDKIDLMRIKLEGMKQALADDINANRVGVQQIAERSMAIQDLSNRIDELIRKEKEENGWANRMSEGFKRAFPTLSGLISRFKQLVKYRMLRAVLKYITAGFKEGLENVYHYSEAIGSAFAPAMDAAASSIQVMKNSIGAAVAPLIQSLIPVLQTVVGWFTQLVNYANQFISLLTGQKSWTRAVPTTVKAFDDQKKSAKGAAAAIKDLLADWDELNIIQSNTAGGGSGSSAQAATDYLSMFEEVGKFDNKIKDIVDFIKENFDTIMSVAEGIGLAILGWKLSSAFGHDLSALQKLELAAGLTLLITGAKLTAGAGYDIGLNGINNENFLKAIGGILEMGLGGGLVGVAFAGITGGVIGLTAGATLGLFLMAAKIQEGTYDSLYGDLTEDVDTIRENIERDYLSMEAKASIEVIDARVKDTQAAETKVRDAINRLNDRYGVHVVIKTKEQAEELMSDVETLVSTTNALIEERKENFQSLYVPVSPAFSNAEEFKLFSEDAWDGISEYVTGIGKKIGDMLGNGITEGVELDTLKARLLEISNAILTGQRSGEFASKVQIAGSGLRTNNFQNYSRKTIMDYMDQYEQFYEDKRLEAIQAASQEYVDRSSLASATEVKYNQLKEDFENGVAGVTQEMVDEAKKTYDKAFAELENFKIEERASQYLKEWTAAGAKLFGQDIFSAVSMAMSKNQNYFGKRDVLDSFIGGKQWITNNDTEVDEYIQGIRDRLINAASTEAGLNETEMRKLLGITGINPLDLFDEAYATKIREAIVEKLTQSKLSYEQKRKIAESFGIDFEPMEEALIEQINEDIKNGKNGGTYEKFENSEVPDAIKDYYDQTTAFVEDCVREYNGNVNMLNRQTIKPEVMKRSGWEFDDDDYATLFTNTFSLGDMKQDGNEFDFEENAVINITPILADGTVLTEEGLKEYVQGLIDEAKSSGKSLMELDAERFNLMLSYDVVPEGESLQSVIDEATKFAIDLHKMQEELYDTPGGYAPWTKNTSRLNPNNVLAAGTVSDVGRQGYSSYYNPSNMQTQNAQEQNNIEVGVEKGVKSANTNQEWLLQQLVNLCRVISQKDFTVQVTPTASWGGFNKKSNAKYGRVTGEVYSTES